MRSPTRRPGPVLHLARVLLLPLLLLLAPSATLTAQQSFGVNIGLDPTGVSDTFSRLHPARSKTFIKASSDPDERPTAPQLGNDDGFSGINAVEAYRFLQGPDEVAVLADIRGRSGYMGCFFRNYWSGLVGLPVQPNERNRAQVVVDGTVAHDMTLPGYHLNPGDPGGQIAPFDGFFTRNRAGGHLTHTPIAWQDSFQVQVFENTFNNAARFHKVCGSLASPENLLTVPDLTAWETVAAQNGGWPHQSVRVPFSRRLNIPGDGGVRLVHLVGPSTILELSCRVGNPDAFDDLWLRITWDDLSRPSVDIPARYLAAVMRRPYLWGFNSVLFNNNGWDRLTSFFPMHFESKARLEFWNFGVQDIQLDLTYAVADGAHPEPWGYFTTWYRRAITTTGVSFRGPKFDGVRGMLRGILLESSINTTGDVPGMDNQHLEGDLCIRVNQNRGDDHTFAATETSVGKWGWYTSPSDLPFASDSSFQSSQLITALPDGNTESNRIQGSTFVFDPVQFVSGMDIVLEHGIQNLSNADYALVAFLYLQEGAAREQILEIDVADAASEAAASVQFGIAPVFRLFSNFFRDVFFNTAPLDDEGRQVQDFYRFTVPIPQNRTWRGLCVAFRLDRERVGNGGICQADILVDGQPAGLLHSHTSNELNRWKEGGELEVELPRTLTDGRSSIVVEVRPIATTEPFRVGNIKVFGYNRD